MHGQALSQLLADLRDHDMAVRGQAANTLIEMGAAAVPGLLEALQDASPRVRLQATVALGKIGDASAVDALLAALNDASWHVCASAAAALGKIGDAKAVPSLKTALQNLHHNPHSDASGQCMCEDIVESLQKIGTPEALAAVAAWQQSKEAGE